VPAALAAATGSAWNAGGSILTFYFPVGLFVVIASILYLTFTRRHTIPGHRPFVPARTAANGPAAAGTAATAGGDASTVPPSARDSSPGQDDQHRTRAEDGRESPADGA
jgi:hypothetical protein